jgi:hypothetical protein
MLRQRRRRPIEGTDVVPAVEQGPHQIGADEAGATGDQDAAEFGCQ